MIAALLSPTFGIATAFIGTYLVLRLVLAFAVGVDGMRDDLIRRQVWLLPVRDAFIATEDRNFYHHHGIDVSGIARAAWSDYHHERFQGASTITQQLARALFLSNQVSISRKIQEALLAIEIRRNLRHDCVSDLPRNLLDELLDAHIHSATEKDEMNESAFRFTPLRM